MPPWATSFSMKADFSFSLSAMSLFRRSPKSKLRIKSFKVCSVLHVGQQCYRLITSSMQCLQNVCPHFVMYGSLNTSKQMMHSENCPTISSTFILTVSSYLLRCFTNPGCYSTSTMLNICPSVFLCDVSSL